MCHHSFDARDRREVETAQEEAEEDDEPSFINEEATVESEILTDGGDEA
jgi:hypothetical protein